jgi:hypothetical protein
MSAMCVFTFQGTHGATGPGMNVPYLDQLGWLDNSQVASMWNTGMGTTDIDLIPLNHPEREGFLAARINFIDRATRKRASYFVELRTADRWDLPYPAVLIHRSESNRSILVGSGRSNRPNLEWQVGELFHDHANMISIGVLSMDSDADMQKFAFN